MSAAIMRAWAPKSPMVTGEASDLETVPFAESRKTRRVRREARCTASWATRSSFWYDIVAVTGVVWKWRDRCVRRERMVGTRGVGKPKMMARMRIDRDVRNRRRR